MIVYFLRGLLHENTRTLTTERLQIYYQRYPVKYMEISGQDVLARVFKPQEIRRDLDCAFGFNWCSAAVLL